MAKDFEEEHKIGFDAQAPTICPDCFDGHHGHHMGGDCKNTIPSGQCCCKVYPWEGREILPFAKRHDNGGRTVVTHEEGFTYVDSKGEEHTAYIKENERGEPEVWYA